MTQPFTLAACAEMLWPGKPMEWRVRRLADDEGADALLASAREIAAVARALNEMSYRGPVGMEAYAAGDPEAALGAFRQAFTI